ncbi:MAG: hypothetical protein EZS28_033679 [Streblomastix strix]|uniref:Uncharacterized protein n=1 Tax=Streblomastix strix TaxID=222440 RepID=A0A5J4UKR0_9EUKA|nr:MAG: hypothetical protein EZS28_033679 [Streblomastix strix]
MVGKKQQARPALKNKPKKQKQQQNRCQHQPQAHKERLKDQKPIIQPEPVVKQIPRAQPRQIPKPQAQQTVQKQVPRALPKGFVKQQQVAKKQREKPAQPIRIVNKQQKYADKRRRYYQIKFQQKQLEREIRDQEFNMEMMEQEKLQARFKRFESCLLPQECDILIRNRLEIQQDCDAFIERVYQHENGRLFKFGFDFGTVIQRSEVIIDPSYVGRQMVEALYPGRTRYKPFKTTALSKYRTPMEVEHDSVSNKQVTYRIRLPDENHVQNHAPTILYSRKSISEFKQYVRSSIIQMQERTEMIDTKELMVAIYSMEKIHGYQYPILTPTAVASTIKAMNYIKTISFDKTQDNFVEKWLGQVFSEALQIRDDYKFAEDVPQCYEVHIIGFDCLKSATTLIFKNIKSMKYEIIDRPELCQCQYGTR